MPLDDQTLDHLRDVARQPALSGDRFEVLELIGQGGMGLVYRAHDRLLDRDVALKVLRSELGTAEGVERLEHESRILARLEHPGIVPIHDIGTLLDGRPCYFMRLVSGQRLDQLDPATSLPERLRLFLRLCETVEFAHTHQVIHRDLKPSNVMLGPFGELQVMDWGIAQLGAGSDTGQRVGTPGFMAPEQLKGDPSLIDRRTDVFGLAAILQWLIDGSESAPRSLRAIADRGRAPIPADRYPSAQELAADVTRFIDGAPVHAYKESLAERMARIYRRYQTPVLLVVAYLVMRLLFLVFWRQV